MEAIADYIEARSGVPGALLWSARKGGRLNDGAGMSDEAVAVILKKCAARAGVGKLSPHDLRRSFVSDLFDAGVRYRNSRGYGRALSRDYHPAV